MFIPSSKWQKVWAAISRANQVFQLSLGTYVDCCPNTLLHSNCWPPLRYSYYGAVVTFKPKVCYTPFHKNVLKQNQQIPLSIVEQTGNTKHHVFVVISCHAYQFVKGTLGFNHRFKNFFWTYLQRFLALPMCSLNLAACEEVWIIYRWVTSPTSVWAQKVHRDTIIITEHCRKCMLPFISMSMEIVKMHCIDLPGENVPISTSLSTTALEEFYAMLSTCLEVHQSEALIVISIFKYTANMLSNVSITSKRFAPARFIWQGSHLVLNGPFTLTQENYCRLSIAAYKNFMSFLFCAILIHNITWMWHANRNDQNLQFKLGAVSGQM